MLRITVTTVCLVFATFTGCAHETQEGHPKGTYAATQPMRQAAELSREFVAQIRAIQHIELRAQETGYLEGIFVDEGQAMERGQKMFQIMPVLFQAELQKAEAEAEFTKIEYENTKLLADGAIVSPSELALAKAKMKKARGELALAKVHRDFTEITAPFDGIMGRFHVRLGSLVEEGELLTTLSDNSTVWVYFNVSEADYLDYMSLPPEERPTVVRLRLANGKLFEQPGKIETIEADFNNETGNIAFRAAFPNPDEILRHGETGRIVMTTALPDALIIPQKATFEVLDKKYVFVVDDAGVARSREIRVAHELPHVYVVADGLTEDDRILLDGLRKVRDGQEVAVRFEQPAQVLARLEPPVR